MILLPSTEIAKAARSLKLAEQCIRKVLRMGKENATFLNMETTAELEAVCVILMRGQQRIWSKYESDRPSPDSRFAIAKKKER